MTTPAADGPLAGLIADARQIPEPFQPRERRSEQTGESRADRLDGGDHGGDPVVADAEVATIA